MSVETIQKAEAPSAAQSDAALILSKDDPKPVAKAAGKSDPEQLPPDAPDVPDDAGADKPAEPEAGKPGVYAWKPSPDGGAYDPTVLVALEGAAKKHGIAPEVAQDLIDSVWPVVAKDLPAARSQKWLDEVIADKELGGTNLDATKQQIGKVMGKYATPELRKLLDETGVGNHKAMVAFVKSIFKDIGEDGLVVGDPAPRREKTLAELLAEPD